MQAVSYMYLLVKKVHIWIHQVLVNADGPAQEQWIEYLGIIICQWLKFAESIKLGDNCIQNFQGMYIIRYTVRNLVLQWLATRAVKHDFRPYIPRYTSPNVNLKILNMVIPILMHFYSFVSNWSVASGIEQQVIQWNVTWLMTSNYFGEYNAGYTVANFLLYQTLCYKIKCIRMWRKDPIAGFILFCRSYVNVRIFLPRLF